ncbi:hypothetical protein VT84_13885 [Gemmata sp. SH-PL17]|uniref:AAA family ATPase n=1 Tax=Gemmata sp. SH-PL17 TaxID=1630693 RepID=UPI00078B9F69|nr:AAA family ATPase [Gemmata sp. SH-PL17]AMV25484.1 hypothetical protein VT84_13885 [Gemmata sp. SH-PL17]
MTLAEAIQANDLLAVARHYLAAGLSVIPVHADGSKAPKFGAWTRYGDNPPTQAELVEWFGRGAKGGIGIPGGPASGNLTVLDVETAEAWDAWLALVPPEQTAYVLSCPLVRTPGGGAHLYVRLELPTRGVTLAERPNGTDDRGRPKYKTLIETRAHGEQVLAPGCPPECHPSGLSYRWERLAWVDGGSAEPVPLDVWVEWMEKATTLTQVQRPQKERRPDTRARGVASADDPGTDFNYRGTWEETGLFGSGWSWARDFGDDRGMVCRPGKSSGISGTIGIVSSRDHGWPLFHCFTTNGAPFEGRKSYSRFAVFAILEHGSDFKAAAKALRAMGYGKQDRPEPVVSWRNTTDHTAPEGAGRGFKWASELAAPPKADDWIWEGYLPRGAVALLSALWKAGKTTLLSHLLRACGDGGTFLGKPLKASKVLYVSEEGERHWVRRRDTLGLNDNVGFYLQPFPTRPLQAGWLGFVSQLKADVENHAFDLVVFDTLAKLWPVQEENDASAVDAALMPLWEVTRAGAGVLLIHHLRKSGGQEYTGSRGSGALSAFPDILIELTRFDAADAKDRKRVLRAKGRYEETPDELVIELVNGEYVAVADTASDEPRPIIGANGAPGVPIASFGASEGEAVIIRVLSEWPEVWMQSDDIKGSLRAIDSGMRDSDVSEYLTGLYFKRQVVRRGTLRSKTNPQMFALASRASSHAAPVSQRARDVGHEMLDGSEDDGVSHAHISCPPDTGAA